MRVLLIFVLVYLLIPSAEAKSEFRNSTGWGRGLATEDNDPGVESYDRFHIAVDEHDWGKDGLRGHNALNFIWTQTAKGVLEGEAVDPVELYFLTFCFGFRSFLSSSFIQPWIGSGIWLGNATISNPENRSHDNIDLLFDREHRFFRGYYGEAGIDVMLSKSFGIRLGYKHGLIRTDPMPALGKFLKISPEFTYLALVHQFEE
jgi:hypothetical protein